MKSRGVFFFKMKRKRGILVAMPIGNRQPTQISFVPGCLIVILGVALVFAVAMILRNDPPGNVARSASHDEPAPATPSPPQVEVSAAAAQDAVKSAQAACLDKLHASAAWKMMAADARDKMDVLSDARKGHDAAAKLDASRAFVATNEQLKQLESDAIEHDAAVSAAKTELANAQARAAQVEQDRVQQVAAAEAERKAQAEAEYNDPIKVAIRTHQLIRGMTIDEASQAMGVGYVSFTDSGSVKLIQWQPSRSALWTATFIDGKAATVSCDAF